MLSNSSVTRAARVPDSEEHLAEESVAGLLGRDLAFPSGLLGFADCQRFRLSRFEAGDGNQSPFYVLNAGDRELSFLVIHPDLVLADYQVPVYPELLARLGKAAASDLVPLLIVTPRERLEDITVNLQGPILIAAGTAMGVQLVIEDYPLHHPLVAK